ncbi:MAG: YkgJ family cysteine cluster protein [Candidatus Omnitrophica bacterium]|nr:YkgJ family cysteine cluster protein [Candidatus Omnitrophota bacterium]
MPDIKQIIPEAFCLKCDGCCRFAEENSPWFPHLLKEEERTISESKLCPVPDKKDNNFLCSFLRIEDNKCNIYETRPFECRLYPFLLNRDTKSGKIFLAVDTNCPFAGENLKKEEFKEYAEYLVTLFRNPDFTKCLKNNPQIIQSYPGARNLAEIKI